MDDWQNKVCGVGDRLNFLFQTKILSDVKFIFDDEEEEIICAHKLILSCASPVFSEMFDSDLTENMEKAIEIEDISAETFSIMLEFIYTDKIVLDTWEHAGNVYGAAKKYLLTALSKFCVDFILENLKAENALEVFEFDELHEEEKVIEAALNIIRKETYKVIESEYFLEIEVSTLITILEQDELQTNEMDLYNALHSLFVTQSDYDPMILSDFQKAVKKINFLEMTPEQFSRGPGDSKFLLPDKSLAILACLHDQNKIKTKYPKDFVQDKRRKCLPRVFFDISADNLHVGRLIMELRPDIVPKTTKQFLAFCTDKKSCGFKGAYVEVEDNRCEVRAKNFSNDNFIEHYMDFENCLLGNCDVGNVGFFSSKGQTDIANFFINTSNDSYYVDCESVVIGKVIEGMNLLSILDKYYIESEICISNCGKMARTVFNMQTKK